MILTIRIGGSELSDVLLELDEVVRLVKSGVAYGHVGDDAALSAHHFELHREDGTRARKLVEKKSSRKGKRNA